MNYRDANMRGICFAQSATSVSLLDHDRLTPDSCLCDANIGKFTLFRLKYIPPFGFVEKDDFSRFFPGRVLFSVFSRLLLLEREYILIASVTKIIQDILL